MVQQQLPHKLQRVTGCGLVLLQFVAACEVVTGMREIEIYTSNQQMPRVQASIGSDTSPVAVSAGVAFIPSS
jgi:hypothetical protein